MADKSADLIVRVVFAAVLFSGLACARVTPPGEVWIKKFDPPYDDRNLKLQLRIDDWWVGTQDVAILPKGTKFPVVSESCNWDPDKCPSWTLPGDVQLQYGPPTSQDIHRLSKFATCTCKRALFITKDIDFPLFKTSLFTIYVLFLQISLPLILATGYLFSRPRMSVQPLGAAARQTQSAAMDKNTPSNAMKSKMQPLKCGFLVLMAPF